MKSTFFSILTFLFFTIGNAQIEKNLGDFHKVTAFDKIDVYLVQASENKAVIKGKEAESVELVNKNGELKIKMSFGNLLKGDAISVTVYYTNLEAVEANEGSRIASNDVFKAINFDIIAKEGSEIKIQLETDRLKVKLLQGSILDINGTAEYCDVLVNTAADYKAKNLISKQTIITTNTGGKADVNATDFVDAKVRAGGSILIHGKPKQINQKVIAGGTIEQAK